jgi:acyl-CoA reductase-like NAD-dependent aldehyde dehydrogenase
MSTNPSTTGGLAGVARPGSSVAVAELDYGPLAADVREVFDSGRTKPIEWRMQQLKQVEKMMVENSDNIIEALAKDLGRPPTESILADIGVSKRDWGLYNAIHFCRIHR